MNFDLLVLIKKILPLQKELQSTLLIVTMLKVTLLGTVTLNFAPNMQNF